tara:strand:+ start:2578 stop:4299 length:1722 start_codon:yes stop_codon:yes gene_type:complete
MGRNNYSYNGMLSVITRKPIFRYTSRQKTSQEVVDELRGESDNRKVDSITNIVSRVFGVPEFYLETNRTGPRLTLNGNPIISLQRFSSYTDLGISSNDVDGSVTTDQSTMDILTPGTYYVTYSARDLLGYLSTIKRTVIIEDTQNTIYTITAGGGIFYVNSAPNPPLTLKRGFTYHFIYSGTSDHPLALRKNDDTPYINGLNTTTNPHTFIVPNDAPSTLKYYCTAHGNYMGNIINIIDSGGGGGGGGGPTILSLLIVGSYYQIDGNDIYTQGTLANPDYTYKKTITRGTDYEIDVSNSALNGKQMRLSTSSPYHISYDAAVSNIYTTNVTYTNNDKISISPDNTTPNYLYLFSQTIGPNVFNVTGSGSRATIYLTRNTTYTFNNSESGSHPLQFSTATDGGGTVLSTGFTGLGTNTTTWDTTSYSGEDYYYSCENHNNMGGNIKIEDSTYTVTIVNSGYGDKYVFNTVSQKTLKLTRGTTYIFNHANESAHPLNFSTGSDGSGNSYTSGITGQGTTQITFVVPNDAPDTIYYHCGIHGGMGGSIEIKGTTFNFSVTNQGNGMPRDAPIEITS